ncbi:hypothetical protein C8C83_0563 [Flavobacterium sp. 90]|nr:hypothetical protein C8C82_0858 [Flavobacterium sp. 81]TCK52754.1 hypothetical protein C8C83_0563 [Flavobacterium sp. 90]
MYLVIIMILFQSCQKADVNDRFLKTLDKVLADTSMITAKEKTLDSLKRLVNDTSDPILKYETYNKIIAGYLWYRADSAYAYIEKNMKIAQVSHNSKMSDQIILTYSIMLSTSGLLNESSQILKKIDRQRLDKSLLRDYYYAQERFYYVSSEFSHDNYYTPLYKRQEQTYQDSVRSTYPKNSIEYNKYTANLMVNAGEYLKARDLLKKTIPGLNKPTRFAAMVYYDLAGIYKVLKNDKLYEYYLIQASIVDRQIPTKENAAIKELAFYLYKNKLQDIDRANLYIQSALADARFYNNRQRILQISEKLPLIVNAFQEKRSKENRHLKYSIIVISILSIFITWSLIFIYRQVIQLRKARLAVDRLNNELQFYNNELQHLNNKLHYANETREENIGLFMDLCSSYINKLDDYKQIVKSKIINNRINDLLKNIDSQQFAKSDKNDFFVNFDRSVLSLFPNFVENVNKLMKEDSQFQLKKGEILNSELRVLALIRLGIDSSNKIASFLHYSPQTIYNYRVKMKNSSRFVREDFEQQLKNMLEVQ